MDGLSTNDEAILLITQHLRYGTVVVPWEVTSDQAGWYVLKNRLSWAVSSDSEQKHQQALTEIIALSQTFTDAEIYRQFSRKTISMKDFLTGGLFLWLSC